MIRISACYSHLNGCELQVILQIVKAASGDNTYIYIYIANFNDASQLTSVSTIYYHQSPLLNNKVEYTHGHDIWLVRK